MTRGETIREDYRPSQASAKVRFTLTGDGDLFPEMLESSEEEDIEIKDVKSITKKGFHTTESVVLITGWLYSLQLDRLLAYQTIRSLIWKPI